MVPVAANHSAMQTLQVWVYFNAGFVDKRPAMPFYYAFAGKNRAIQAKFL